MGWPVCDASQENETIHEVGLWDGGITFHTLALIVGAVFALIAGGVSFYLIMCHATHYSKPLEQRHIIRILWMVPIYSLVAWLSILFYKNSVYYSLIGHCYEAFAISAFFALLCHYIAPDLHLQKGYFRGINPRPWIWPVTWFKRCCGGDHGIWRTPRSGLTWFNVIWASVFQYCFFRVLMTIIAVVTQSFNVYCEESLNPAFSHVWVMVIESVCVTIAMYCLIQFYLQIKGDIAQHSPFLKILSIKLVIFLSFWQSTLISFLFSSGAIKPTKTIQANDLKVGIPNLLIPIEMALFAILHLWAFAWQPYATGPSPGDEMTDFSGNGKPVYHGGPFGLKAILDALNPLDLIKAVSRGLRWLFVGRKKRTLDPSYRADGEAIGLKPADSGPGPSATAYEGTGRFMSGGRAGSTPDEEGAVLLGHAQPNPTTYGRSSGDMGMAPSPDEVEEQDGRFYSSNRLNASPMLEPTSHFPRAYSPYGDRSHSPYSRLSEAGQERGVSSSPPHGALQEQVPMPMDGPFQPPPLHDDDYEYRGRR